MNFMLLKQQNEFQLDRNYYILPFPRFIPLWLQNFGKFYISNYQPCFQAAYSTMLQVVLSGCPVKVKNLQKCTISGGPKMKNYVYL